MPKYSVYTKFVHIIMTNIDFYR